MLEMLQLFCVTRLTHCWVLCPRTTEGEAYGQENLRNRKEVYEAKEKDGIDTKGTCLGLFRGPEREVLMANEALYSDCSDWSLGMAIG